MPEKLFMRATHALTEAALRSGCKFYLGYPITPITEAGEYWSEHAEEHGASPFMVESELEAGAMLLGTSASGARTMFGGNGASMSLIAESLSTMAGMELPMVLADFPRGDGGAGSLTMGQGDYFQVTKAIAQGDFHLVTLSPHTVQECVDLTFDAFWLADKFRVPVVIMGDWILGMSMEAVAFPDRDPFEGLEPKTWALDGDMSRPKRHVTGGSTGGMVTSVNVGDVGKETGDKRAPVGPGERSVRWRYDKYSRIPRRWDALFCDDAEVVVASWGSLARIVKTVVYKLRREGLKVGHFRPITLYPYPYEALGEATKKAREVLVLECNTGMMLEDVKLGLNGRLPVEFYGRPGGVCPTMAEIEYEIRQAYQKKKVAA